MSGDLTAEGYRQEYKNWVAYAERIQAPMLTVPGNHDSRNVGYLHFEDLIGPRMWSHDVEGVRIVGIDSSEPDLNEGKVGRVHYDWIRRQFEEPAELKVFVLHHHLLPIPGTGRERSTVMDAGDLLEVLDPRRRAGRALGPQARAVRVAAREHVRRERRHRVVVAGARLHQALLQRAWSSTTARSGSSAGSRSARAT